MEPIDPILIPHYTGDLGELEKAVASLKKDASDIRATGANTHSMFQRLAPDYDAPERDQLLATTIPVRDQADRFAHGLERVQAALSTYAAEIGPIVKELDRLREQAAAFRDSVKGDEHWQKSQGKTDENARLIRAVAVAQEKFHAAERDAVNKITAVYCGTSFLTVDDGSHKPGMYGYDPDAVAKVTETPWGKVVKREHGTLEKVWDHVANNPIADVYKGFLIDGTWGSVRGLGTMVGWDGGDKAAAAWKNLGLLVAGSATFPLSQATRLMPDSWLPKQAREYKKAAMAADKGFLAWDEWKKNPCRAWGALNFNVLTTLIPEAKAAGVARAGTATGRVMSTVARVGEIADPVNLALKGVGKGFTAAKGALETARIGDLHRAALENAAHLTERIPGTNEKALRLTTADETPTYIREDGTWLRADGSEFPAHGVAPKELNAAERGAAQDHRVLAHVGGDSGEAGRISTGHASPGSAGHQAGGHGTSVGASNPGTHSTGHGAQHDPAHSSESGHGEGHEFSGQQGHDGHGGSGEDDSASGESGGDPADPAVDGGGTPREEHLDPEVQEHLTELKRQGHAPGRHYFPADEALQKRLGEPQTDANGDVKLYGPNSENPGLVKSQNNIDPLTGTTTDGVHGRSHRVGAFATRFDRAEDMVKADEYFREYMKENGMPPPGNTLPIEEILGPEGYKHFTGYYINPAKTSEFLKADFEGGTIKAIYDVVDGEYHLTTMYSNPAPGRHP
ncbi:hypothetical protein AB0A70_28020 [Streptomyces morookaense]|uniref:hypothetical protein n=1 Tax=Streptomyces morookaense TaxID=1970 RepID=UPI00340F2C69